jgi:hypothetical protein
MDGLREVSIKCGWPIFSGRRCELNVEELHIFAALPAPSKLNLECLTAEAPNCWSTLDDLVLAQLCIEPRGRLQMATWKPAFGTRTPRVPPASLRTNVQPLRRHLGRTLEAPGMKAYHRELG